MAHLLPPEHVRQVNKLEWPYSFKKLVESKLRFYCQIVKYLVVSNIKRGDNYGMFLFCCVQFYLFIFVYLFIFIFIF